MSLKVLVISSVLPIESGGGELVLRRHLLDLDPSRWSVHLAYAGAGIDLPEDWPVHRLARLPLPERLRRTRLAPRLNDLVFSGRLVSRRSLARLVRQLRPDVILTVAHGEMAPVARWVAEQFTIPLVTLFHDWWPDIVHGTIQGAKFLEEEFHKLFHASNAALCVCEGMCHEFGGGDHASVLLPVPGRGNARPNSANRKSNTTSPLNFAYTGTLAGAYGEMIFELAEASASHPDIHFRFSGYHASLGKNTPLPGYQGALPFQAYKDFMVTNDLLLVTMSFFETDQRRARTSFPSKLLEYAQHGRAILIWGPEGCSAVQWARQTGAAEIVTNNSVEAVLGKVEELRRNPSRMQVLAEAVQHVASNDFQPERIQKKFEAALEMAAASR